VLIKPKSWQRHGLKPWLEAAKRRLHRNVLAIALANTLARIAELRGEANPGSRSMNNAMPQPDASNPPRFARG
jgi:hypothetical protein